MRRTGRAALRVARRPGALLHTKSSTSAEVHFEDPPLNEVVFSVQFDADVIDEVDALSKFRPEIRERFPHLEKQPPFPPAKEEFDVPSPQVGPHFEFLSGPSSHRYWFVSEDGTKLVQVQGDRFLFNWRQVTGEEIYPRFHVLCPEFVELFEIFLSVLATPPVVAWCELSYINPIPVEAGEENTHGELARIINYLVRSPTREALPPVEDTQIQQRFRILDTDTGEPVGRFYVTAMPGFQHTDPRPVYVITLIARGRPVAGHLPQSVVGFLERAHDMIVRAFKEVTTPEMHKQWRMQE